MAVTRCVCHDVSFAALIDLARRTGADFAELSRLTGCGTGCGTCRPYIAVALATGRSVLPVMSPGAFERLRSADSAAPISSGGPSSVNR